MHANWIANFKRQLYKLSYAPANIRRWPNVRLLLAHRLRRWPNSKPTLSQRTIFTGEQTFSTYIFSLLYLNKCFLIQVNACKLDREF